MQGRKTMIERAYAKINLCLDVVRKREDGYHELRMIMVPIDFYDILEMERAEETTISLNRTYLPVDNKNTVIKAIHLMQEAYGITQNYNCRLQKHIPTQAGLAGGSADAAAAIRLINKDQYLNLSIEEMISIAKQVGADVPFCIVNKPALVEGIGEKIETFKCNPDFYILLVKPSRGVSTKRAFEALNFDSIIHPKVDEMRNALIKNDYEEIIQCLGNSLEEVSLKLVDEIREVKEELIELGFDGVLMSGSGSTVFGITRNKRILREASVVMKGNRNFVRSCRILVR